MSATPIWGTPPSSSGGWKTGASTAITRFPPTPGRTAKHARHLLRLLTQGLELHEEGELTVRLDDPERYREFGERVAAGDLDAARMEIEDAEHAFSAHVSPLPDEPDRAIVQDWLLDTRKAFW
jgi:uncharacterized protein